RMEEIIVVRPPAGSARRASEAGPLAEPAQGEDESPVLIVRERVVHGGPLAVAEQWEHVGGGRGAVVVDEREPPAKRRVGPPIQCTLRPELRRRTSTAVDP